MKGISSIWQQQLRQQQQLHVHPGLGLHVRDSATGRGKQQQLEPPGRLPLQCQWQGRPAGVLMYNWDRQPAVKGAGVCGIDTSHVAMVP